MPEPLVKIAGIAAPLPHHNIDTDVIMPKRFLRTITREGLADGVLADLRFDADGVPDPRFILNRSPWDHARILVVGDNFGCGSSREHAVWGLHQWGIRALIGTSYAGIFYDNCRRNGLAAISVCVEERDRLMERASRADTARMTIHLDGQVIEYSGGQLSFQMPSDVRDDLMSGRDFIASTLEHSNTIRAFEQAYHG